MKFESIIILFGNALTDRYTQNVPLLEQLQKHGSVIPKGNNINSSVSSCHFGFTSEIADHKPIKRSKGNAIGHMLGSLGLSQGFSERADSKSQ